MVVQALESRNIRAGLISNTDSRMRMSHLISRYYVTHLSTGLALEDLGVLSMLSPTLFSEEEGIEKPSPEIWHRALNRAGLDASQAIHVGDEIAAYVEFCFLGVALT
jgi:beta-phosphoglucomutase-like phosphatase (HAD superfamily)